MKFSIPTPEYNKSRPATPSISTSSSFSTSSLETVAPKGNSSRKSPRQSGHPKRLAATPSAPRTPQSKRHNRRHPTTPSISNSSSASSLHTLTSKRKPPGQAYINPGFTQQYAVSLLANGNNSPLPLTAENILSLQSELAKAEIKTPSAVAASRPPPVMLNPAEPKNNVLQPNRPDSMPATNAKRVLLMVLQLQELVRDLAMEEDAELEWFRYELQGFLKAKCGEYYYIDDSNTGLVITMNFLDFVKEVKVWWTRYWELREKQAQKQQELEHFMGNLGK